MALKRNRSMKVYEQRGCHYKESPAIMLKGQWLKELEFDIGDFISGSCEKGKLIITSDVERAALDEAEASFTEKETKKLQKYSEQKKARLGYRFEKGRINYRQGTCNLV